MHAMVTRRRMNPARAQETRERAAREFWPMLQRAPGFVSFTLVQCEDGVSTALLLFEDKAQLDAIRDEATAWQRTLDAAGHQLEAQHEGAVVRHLTPQS